MDLVDQVKQLREETGAGIMECKRALAETKGDLVKAKEILKKQGLAKAKEKDDRETKEGFVATYTHTNGKIGVMVEIFCESDFVARSDQFRQFAKDLCLQIASMAPENLKELLAQDYIRDPAVKIGDLVKLTVAKFGESIKIGKFERFEI